MIFSDRADAGRQLAESLSGYSGSKDVVVLGIPRGGVVVAYEVARRLEAPLDLFLSAKLPVPGQEELAFGAMVEDGTCFLNDDIILAARVSEEEIEQTKAVVAQRLRARALLYRTTRQALNVECKSVILVDDGIATGASMQVSILALRSMRTARLAIGVPVAPASTCRRLTPLVDELVCLIQPRDFSAVSQFYREFLQTSDEEVAELLRRGAQTSP
ncbi:MAG TPA: phosphoribosyltransferase family protein [Terracidiphilus sp.]|nr:phosphoribosyltransferase family protein [Terracidiphilus sp.]